MTKRKPISLDNIKSYPLKSRESKVTVDDFAKPWQIGGNMGMWMDSLPGILAAKDFKEIVANVVEAVRNKKMIILAMGAHAIKVGLNPVIIDLMDRGVTTSRRSEEVATIRGSSGCGSTTRDSLPAGGLAHAYHSNALA